MSSFMHSKEPPRSEETNGVKTRFATLFGCKCKVANWSGGVFIEWAHNDSSKYECAGTAAGTYIGTVAQQEGDDGRVRLRRGDVQRRAPGVGRVYVGASGHEQHRQLAIPCTNGQTDNGVK
jgi:hypothetical protein